MEGETARGVRFVDPEGIGGVGGDGGGLVVAAAAAAALLVAATALALDTPHSTFRVLNLSWGMREANGRSPLRLQ